MEHMTDTELMAYLDGELGEEERVATARHLRRCPACLDALDSLRRAADALSAALRRIDRPAPAGDAARIRELRAARAPGIGAIRAGGRAWSRRPLLAAAVLLIAITGAAAAAIPGSPVRAWLSRSVERVAHLLERTEEEPAASQVTEAGPGAGVAVRPGRDGVRVELVDPGPDVLVRVSFVDAELASVRAAGGRFRTAEGSIRLEGARGEVDIAIPRGAAAARVEVDGRRVLERRDTDIVFLAPTADSAGAEIFFRPGG